MEGYLLAKLTYGIKEGKLYHIDEVEQGLKCDCICPNCKEKLVARKGDINEHHFAHSAKECDITVAQETALHIMAKEILAEYKIIKLPKFTLHSKTGFFNKVEYKNINGKIDKSKFICDYENGEEYILQFDNVYVEKSEKDIIPDLICESNGNKFFIEIAITNFIREAKYNKIKNHKIPTIEIDLSQYKDKVETLTKRRLGDILIDDIELKHWIYNPIYENDIDKIIINNKYEIERQLSKIKECTEMFYPENYLRYENMYGDTNHAKNFWNKQMVSKKYKEIPDFIGYKIYGDFIFQIDRRIWQSFILNTIYLNNLYTSPNTMWKRMKDKTFLRVNPDFLEPIWISENMQYSGLDVVEKYYRYLEYRNVIDEKGILVSEKEVYSRPNTNSRNKNMGHWR